MGGIRSGRTISRLEALRWATRRVALKKVVCSNAPVTPRDGSCLWSEAPRQAAGRTPVRRQGVPLDAASGSRAAASTESSSDPARLPSVLLSGDVRWTSTAPCEAREIELVPTKAFLRKKACRMRLIKSRTRGNTSCRTRLDSTGKYRDAARVSGVSRRVDGLRPEPGDRHGARDEGQGIVQWRAIQSDARTIVPRSLPQHWAIRNQCRREG